MLIFGKKEGGGVMKRRGRKEGRGEGRKKERKKYHLQ